MKYMSSVIVTVITVYGQKIVIIKKNVALLFLVCKFAINIFALYLGPVYMEVGDSR